MTTLQNFNISVAITDKFMEALERGEGYELYNPKSGEVMGTRSAAALWDTLVNNAWKNGDPGMVFIDRINAGRANPVPPRGPVESTNPCGEQPLYPYDSCNLGSINLGHFTKGEAGSKTVDYERLGKLIHRTVHLLDNVIEMNAYPIPEIAETSHSIRRIGLGVMGWADMLIDLRVPYDSNEALDVAREVMAFIQREADNASERLAALRGTFPDWKVSVYGPGGSEGPRPMRNSTRTTIAPTGTLSIIADCSGGIEPAARVDQLDRQQLDDRRAHGQGVEQPLDEHRAVALGLIEGNDALVHLGHPHPAPVDHQVGRRRIGGQRHQLVEHRANRRSARERHRGPAALGLRHSDQAGGHLRARRCELVRRRVLDLHGHTRPASSGSSGRCHPPSGVAFNIAVS